jgi:hypothetical protein
MTDTEPLESKLEFIKDYTWNHPHTKARNPLYTVLQTEYRENYGYAIVDKDSLELIKNHIIGKKTLEINSGKGFWTYCLRLLGCDIVATDLFRQDSFWIPVEQLDAVSAVEKYNDKCSVLLCSWPDNNMDYAYEALRKFTGDTVVYIGEGKTGCCATNSFFDYLEQYYQKLEIEDTLQSWPFVNDCLSIYNKK